MSNAEEHALDYKTMTAEITGFHRALDEHDPDLDQPFTPAMDEDVADVEARLGVRLPPSYREFVLTVNGCPKLGMAHGGLWPVDKIDWFRNLNQDWIDAYTMADGEDVSEEEHLANPEDSALFRHSYLPELLQIGEQWDGSVYLLNPKVTTPAGEWEAWAFANWYPGAVRVPSFRDLVVSAHKQLAHQVHLCSVEVDEAAVLDKALPVHSEFFLCGPVTPGVAKRLSGRVDPIA